MTFRTYFCWIAILSSLLSTSHNACYAWSNPPPTQGTPDSSTRRHFASRILAAGTFAIMTSPVKADTGAEVRGIELNAFNGLAFQYRGSEFGGLAASDIGEPSISYADFISKLQQGQVEFVEFLAPNGDVAYATIQGKDQPIRIGEGYPIEQPDGYSSPAFCVRAVKNAKVPYKFTVPALAAYPKSSN